MNFKIIAIVLFLIMSGNIILISLILFEFQHIFWQPKMFRDKKKLFLAHSHGGNRGLVKETGLFNLQEILILPPCKIVVCECRVMV